MNIKSVCQNGNWSSNSSFDLVAKSLEYYCKTKEIPNTQPKNNKMKGVKFDYVNLNMNPCAPLIHFFDEYNGSGDSW